MKRIFTYLVTVLLLALQGCIKEESSNCESVLLLRFRYTLNDQYANLFESEVNRVTIYVFDCKGMYVGTFTEQGDKLTNDYVMRVPLPKGKYSVVVYGGDLSTYSVGGLSNETNIIINTTLNRGVTTIADLRLALNGTTGEENYLYPTETPNDLYAGLAVNTTSVPNNKTITDVELIKDTKKIKVKITGTSVIDGLLDVYITAPNGRYLYDNSIDPEHGTFKYAPIHSSTSPSYMEVDMKTMRLTLGGTPILVITNKTTSEVIYNENIIDQSLLTGKYVTQEDFDREDEFVFEITLTIDLQVIVSINGWVVNNINPSTL